MEKIKFKEILKELIESGELEFIPVIDRDVYEGTETLSGIRVKLDGEPIRFFYCEENRYGL